MTYRELFTIYRKPILIGLLLSLAHTTNSMPALYWFSNTIYAKEVTLNTANIFSNI